MLSWCFLYWIVSSFISESSSSCLFTDCSEIVLCSPNLLADIDDSETGVDYKLRNEEKTIGEQRHWRGFRPWEYNLTLSFKNTTFFDGSVDIIGDVAQSTRSFAVNIDFDYVSYNYSMISISRCSPVQPPNVCIERVVHHSKLQYVELKLNDTVDADDQCVIHIPYFDSSPRLRIESNRSTVGLRVSGGQGFSAISTDFRMRYARTVFPCLDHPWLKASFDLTIHHPGNYTVVSNAHSLYVTPNTTDNQILNETWPRTLPISTYMFGFVLLNGYEIYVDSGYQVFQAWVPEPLADRYSWLPNAALEMFLYMTGIAYVPRPHTPYYLVVLASETPQSTVSYCDLIFYDADSLEHSDQQNLSSSNRMVLYETMLRQWIGGAFSVRYWNEICLEEGLFQYFLWYEQDRELSASGRRLTVESLEQVCETRRRPLVDNDNDVFRLDTRECRLQAGAFFKSLADLFGHKLVANLLTGIVTPFPFAMTAGPTEFDHVLQQQNDYSPQLNGYVETFFRQSEPTELFVEFDHRLAVLEINVGKSASLPIPLKIYFSSSPDPIMIVLTTYQYRDYLTEDISWVLIDPDGQTWSRKIYDIETFSRLLRPDSIDLYQHLTDQRRRAVLRQFCYAFTNNLLTTYDKGAETWEKLLENVCSLDASCKCCLFSAENATTAPTTVSLIAETTEMPPRIPANRSEYHFSE